MKHIVFFVLLLGSLHCSHAQNPSTAEMQPLTARFTAAMQGAAASPRGEKLKADYLQLLDAVFKQVTAAGDLNGALQVKAEKERFQKGEATTEQARIAMIPVLRAARDKYDRASQPLQLERQTAENTARRQYILELDQLQKQLTQRAELEKAVAVKAERDRMAAQLTPTPGAPTGQGSGVPVARDPTTSFHMGLFYNKLKTAAVSPRIPKNTLGKRDRGAAFQDLPKEGALLVGFEMTKGDWFGAPLLRSVQPIYLTTAGKVKGAVYGKPGGSPFVVEARDGYAVGGVLLRDGDFLWTLEITFMKIDAFHKNLDKTDSYKSEVAGDTVKYTDNPKTHAGDGLPIIGIFGYAKEEINALGFIQAP